MPTSKNWNHQQPVHLRNSCQRLIPHAIWHWTEKYPPKGSSTLSVISQIITDFLKLLPQHYLMKTWNALHSLLHIVVNISAQAYGRWSRQKDKPDKKTNLKKVILGSHDDQRHQEGVHHALVLHGTMYNMSAFFLGCNADTKHQWNPVRGKCWRKVGNWRKLELFCRMLYYTITAVLMPFYWMLNNNNNKGNFYHLPHKVGA